VKPRKLLLLLLILVFGGSVEIVTRANQRLAIGPAGCRVLGGRFYGPSFAFESTERSELAAGAAVEIENRFGNVTVAAGEPGHVVTTLRTVVYLPTESAARAVSDRVKIEAHAAGAGFAIGTNRNQLLSEDVGFETHLTVRVPPATPVKLKNEHGKVAVADVARAEIENAYDAVELRQVAGDATLSTQHGGVDVAAVNGSLSLVHRYGDVSIRDVGGPTTLTAAHGDARLERVGALKARLVYGDFVAATVRGDLEFTGEHAGVDVSDVDGAVAVTSAYRKLRVTRVKGAARLSGPHSEIEAEDVGGDLTVDSSYDGVTLKKVAGRVEVKVEHGGVDAQDLASGGRIEASGDDVSVHGFRAALEVKARGGDVRLAPRGPLAAPVSVVNAHGGIRLEVAAGSRFGLDASARPGEVRVDLADVRASESGRGRFRGNVGEGGPQVSLSDQHGDIEVVPAGAAHASADAPDTSAAPARD